MNNPTTAKLAEKLNQCIYLAFYDDEAYYANLFQAAYDRIEALEHELIDERYRHDRLQDFCVAQGEELTKLKAQQRWIPVTESLPEDDDDVLIMSSGSISMGYYSTYNEYWADYINVYYNDVTHWMPLPEAPKE